MKKLLRDFESVACEESVDVNIEAPLIFPGVPVTLVHSFIAIRAGLSGNGLFAFTSAKPGEGVTYVVRALGAQLAAYTGGEILIVNAATLATLSCSMIDDCESFLIRCGPGLWMDTGLERRAVAKPAGRIEAEVARALRRRFSFVLIDCAALSQSSEAIALGREIDATVLVAAAGRSRKQDIQQAARLLTAADVRFTGCILNNRTYPIPRMLYKLF
ncbi:MAG: hypothetical protein WB676_13235 [Bryobacteraceae bacterium]